MNETQVSKIVFTHLGEGSPRIANINQKKEGSHPHLICNIFDVHDYNFLLFRVFVALFLSGLYLGSWGWWTVGDWYQRMQSSTNKISCSW